MLMELGFADLGSFVDRVLPDSIKMSHRLAEVLPVPLSESEVLAELRSRASENRPLRSMIGNGYFGTFTPPVITRNLLENPAWYTAYKIGRAHV